MKRDKLESSVEGDSCSKAEEAGWKTRKVVSPGRRGAFDRVFIKEGRTVWIEFKKKGGRPSGLQKLEYKQLIKAGAEAHFVYSVGEALQILGIKEYQ